MHTIHLHAGVSSNAAVSIGMAPSYLLSGNLLCVGPDWWIVGAYRDHCWDVHSRHFTWLEFAGPRLTLKTREVNPGERSWALGPFSLLALVGNELRGDVGALARLDESPFHWRLHAAGISVRDLMIEMAGAAKP